MKIALVAAPVPAAPLSFIQRDYYFYLFAIRVLTVFNHLAEEDFKRFWMLESVHLGLLQLIAFLERNGHTCSFFTPVSPPGNEERREQGMIRVLLDNASCFDLMGFSAITASYPAAARMAHAVRRKYPHLPLVIGGPHAWACDRDILEHSDFDFVVRQEGELTALELVHALENNQSLKTVSGLSYKENGHIICNPDRSRMNRGSLPFPAYNHLEDNIPAKVLMPFHKISIPVARVTPTTGCTNSCVWCADFWKPGIQKQNLETFYNEVVYLMQERDSRYFYLGTHNFFYEIDYALRIAETIGKAAPSVHWEAQTRVNKEVTAGIMKKLVQTGCRCLHMGIESADQTLLDAMGKNITIADARNMCEIALNEGIYTHTYWIIGSPFETRETAIRTIKTMKEWLGKGISTCSEINLLVGYPGTRFYRDYKQYGITWQDPDFSHYDGRSTPVFETRYLTKRDIEYLYHRALDEYCEALMERNGDRKTIMQKLGNRMPAFDPAVMEAVF
ncbi:MAG: B12-binding domain-containing radical SAM protein [Spirochaetales bacterium]|nr:B12-binding domain-containing radical SAM protein [Spirochaetales bacterium]